MMLNSQWFIASIWDSMISMISYPASFHGYFCNCLGLAPPGGQGGYPSCKSAVLLWWSSNVAGALPFPAFGWLARPEKMAGLGEHINGIWCFVIHFSIKNKLSSRYSFIFWVTFSLFAWFQLWILYSMTTVFLFRKKVLIPTPFTGDLEAPGCCRWKWQRITSGSTEPSTLQGARLQVSYGFTTCEKLERNSGGTPLVTLVIQVCQMWNEPVGESFRAGGISVSASKKNTSFFPFKFIFELLYIIYIYCWRRTSA